ncbi:MAG: InlB B-repeat-containing protein [Firmicutes bacterium]|nr:InlB B-repeat-containing protein [Bacillota bacterium]
MSKRICLSVYLSIIVLFSCLVGIVALLNTTSDSNTSLIDNINKIENFESSTTPKFKITFQHTGEYPKGDKVPDPIEVTLGELPPALPHYTNATNPSYGRSLYGFYTIRDGQSVFYYGAYGETSHDIGLLGDDLIPLRVWDIEEDTILIPAYGHMNWYKDILLNPNGGTLIDPKLDDTKLIAVAPWTKFPSGYSAPTRIGYKFAGFYDNLNDSLEAYGKQWYDENMVCQVDEDEINLDHTRKTLHAKWIVNDGIETVVKFDKKNGDGGTNKVRVITGKNMTQATAPTMRTAIFTGYYDRVEGGKQYYDENMRSVRVWDRAESTTLYARWENKEYTVTLDPNSGSGGTTEVMALWGENLPYAIAPMRDGYMFMGYLSTRDGGTQYYNYDMKPIVWDKKRDWTIYAQWQKAEFTATLDFQGGRGGSSKVSVMYGNIMPRVVAPNRDGYIFSGYYDIVGGKQYYDKNMNSMRPWDVRGDGTLYAKWEKEEEVLPPPPTEPTAPTNPSSVDFGGILGWSGAGIALVAIILGGVLFVLRRKRNMQSSQQGNYSSQNNYYNNQSQSNYRNNNNGW